MHDTLSSIAKQLLLLADEVHDANLLTCEHVQSADRLLWRAYEVGAFPGDELFRFAVQRYREETSEDGELIDGQGFAEAAIHHWLRIRVPGVTCCCESTEERQDFGHAIREAARLLLAGQSPTIPSVERTVPMSYRRAAKLMGKGDSQDAAEWLSKSVADGSIPCDHISRQTHVFSRKSFPEAAWPQITPK